jgi:integrase/recombinase XerD
MLRDVCDPVSFPRYFRRLQDSPFRQDIEDFASWLIETGYRSKIFQYVSRLDRTLRSMPEAAPHAVYTVAQLQLAFGRNDTSPGTVIAFRSTQRCFQRFLSSRGRLRPEATHRRFGLICDQYCQQLVELRGFTASTVHHHRTVVGDFLDRSVPTRRSLHALNAARIQHFLALRSKEITRQSLQHVVAVLRAFLRYCHDRGMIKSRLDEIDTQRTYRDELLPRALEWQAVQALLRSIDRDGRSGERDYTILHLMAHYGLRPSEIISLRLDSIDWRTSTLTVHQRKTRSGLVLPLSIKTVGTLRRYLRRARVSEDGRHTELFLSARCPVAPLMNTAIYGIFAKRAAASGIDITSYSAYSLRHAFAMRLLERGVGVKAIGDLLGHRNLESTCVYLRLDITALRQVALEIPRVVRSGDVHAH